MVFFLFLLFLTISHHFSLSFRNADAVVLIEQFDNPTPRRVLLRLPTSPKPTARVGGHELRG